MLPLDTACRSRASRGGRKKGDLLGGTVHGLGAPKACPPPQKLYLILRPCEHLPLARRVLFTSSCPLRSGRYIPLWPGHSTRKSPLHRQNIHQATPCTLICRPSEPSNTHAVPRIIRCQSSHLHRAVPFPVYRHARLYIRMTAAAASRAP